MTRSKLKIVGDRFVDTFGRQIISRVTQLGGGCKLSCLDGYTVSAPELPIKFPMQKYWVVCFYWVLA
ncbi:MAG: hypothetical protein JKY01_11315 [Pseudomonadales bacterium]|nr:hypothetical protein [Pseudomonadales bacterium]